MSILSKIIMAGEQKSPDILTILEHATRKYERRMEEAAKENTVIEEPTSPAEEENVSITLSEETCKRTEKNDVILNELLAIQDALVEIHRGLRSVETVVHELNNRDKQLTAIFTSAQQQYNEIFAGGSSIPSLVPLSTALSSHTDVSNSFSDFEDYISAHDIGTHVNSIDDNCKVKNTSGVPDESRAELPDVTTTPIGTGREKRIHIDIETLFTKGIFVEKAARSSPIPASEATASSPISSSFELIPDEPVQRAKETDAEQVKELLKLIKVIREAASSPK